MHETIKNDDKFSWAYLCSAQIKGWQRKKGKGLTRLLYNLEITWNLWTMARNTLSILRNLWAPEMDCVVGRKEYGRIPKIHSF